MVLVDDAVVMAVTREAAAVVAAQKLRGAVQGEVNARIAERADPPGAVLHGNIDIGDVGSVGGKAARCGVQRQLQGGGAVGGFQPVRRGKYPFGFSVLK